MEIRIPPKPAWVIESLARSGHEAGLVGGCLRDLLLGLPVKDYDVCTSATPEEMRVVFAGLPLLDVGERFGTLVLLLEGERIEVTTFRREGGYQDFRHPSLLEFTRALEEDLLRRDFTINALYYNDVRGLVDLSGGLSDLDSGLIRAIGDPAKRFGEDPLRILRGLRFASVLGFRIEEGTGLAMLSCRELLGHVKGERVAVELGGIFSAGVTAGLLERFEGIFRVLVPELVSFDPGFIARQGSLVLRLGALLSGVSGPSVIRQVIRRLRLSCSPALGRMELVRVERLAELNALPVADSLESLVGALEACSWDRGLFSSLLELKGLAPVSVLPDLEFRELAVDGLELAGLGLEGAAIGAALGSLYRGVLLGLWPNSREALLREAGVFVTRSRKASQNGV